MTQGDSDLCSTRSQTLPYGGGSAATISSSRRDASRVALHIPHARLALGRILGASLYMNQTAVEAYVTTIRKSSGRTSDAEK